MKRSTVKMKKRIPHTRRPQVTEVGRAVLMGTILFFLACLIIPAFGVLSALITLNVMALIVGYVYRPRLAISASYRQRIMAGESVYLTYTIRNLASISAYHLTMTLDSLPAGLRLDDSSRTVPILRPHESIEVSFQVWSERRGRFLIPAPVCYSSFPLNLLQFSVPYLQEQPLCVLPLFYKLDVERSFVETTSSSDFFRSGMISGLCPEYVGNRPFMVGDSRRQIDARAWARLATPAVKEFHEAFQTQVALVLDTTLSRKQRHKREEPVLELEAGISLCASMAYTLDKDCQIDWLVTGTKVHPLFHETHIKRCDLIHDILTEVQPTDKVPSQHQIMSLIGRFKGVSEVFFILLNWTAHYQKWIQLAQRAGCEVKVFFIRSRTDRDIEPITFVDHIPIHTVDAEYILQKNVVSL